MSGHDDREQTRRIADMYDIGRPVEEHRPLWPRLKQGAEWWGIASMVRALWPF